MNKNNYLHDLTKYRWLSEINDNHGSIFDVISLKRGFNIVYAELLQYQAGDRIVYRYYSSRISGNIDDEAIKEVEFEVKYVMNSIYLKKGYAIVELELIEYRTYHG